MLSISHGSNGIYPKWDESVMVSLVVADARGMEAAKVGARVGVGGLLAKVSFESFVTTVSFEVLWYVTPWTMSSGQSLAVESMDVIVSLQKVDFCNKVNER
jgi:hypothetical protein